MTDEERLEQEVAISNAVYQATVEIFERLEAAGAIYGNGHHAAQKLAARAQEELRRRWNRNT